MKGFDNRQHRCGHPGAGLARALSKLGFCSRTQAAALILHGRVRVNGTVRRDPGWSVDLKHDRIEVEGQVIRSTQKIYLMLNKPRGLVTSASDEQGRPTVFACLPEGQFPHLAPVGRLDKASEGLLLLTNDTHWAAAITDPMRHVDKIYHVQIERVAAESLLESLMAGREFVGERWAVKQARILRQGTRTSWLEITLDEGKNRHIRRLLEGLGVPVRRLVRVAIGSLALGSLAKGAFRILNEQEVRALARESVLPRP